MTSANVPAVRGQRAVDVRASPVVRHHQPVIRRRLGAAGWFFLAVIVFMFAGLLTSLGTL